MVRCCSGDASLQRVFVLPMQQQRHSRWSLCLTRWPRSICCHHLSILRSHSTIILQLPVRRFTPCWCSSAIDLLLLFSSALIFLIIGTAGGDVYSWGFGDNGQLGQRLCEVSSSSDASASKNSEEKSFNESSESFPSASAVIPTKLRSFSRVLRLATGNTFTLALRYA